MHGTSESCREAPTTIGFTAFTIVAREGLEAIIILAALFAGLRGADFAATRKGIAGGAWMGLLITAITFMKTFAGQSSIR